MSVQTSIDRLNTIKVRIRTNLAAQGITVPEDSVLAEMAEQILSVAGEDGRGIVSVTRTSGTGAAGTTDTYTITYTDSTTSTFDVYNGADGKSGADYVLTDADKTEIAEAAADMVDVPEVVQETGDSEDAVMSQAAATRELESLSESIADQQTQLDGKQPIGNYLTEVPDEYVTKDELETEINDIKAQGVQQTPLFAESVEWLIENGDTSKVYVIQDETNPEVGYIYAYKSGEVVQAHTNKILSSIESDEQPYNGGVGYKTGYRLNSSGEERTLTNGAVSGFIRYEGGDIELRVPTTELSNSYAYLHTYSSSFSLILENAAGALIDGSFRQLNQWVSNYGATVTEEESTLKYIIPSESLAISDIYYVRVSSSSSLAFNDTNFDMAIGESLDDTITTGYAWVNTGMTIAPSADEVRIVELERKTNDHESRLKLLEANDDNSGVPSYWLSELETKADMIQQAMEAAGRNKSAFLWYTDAHWQSNSKMSPVLLWYLQRNTPINKVNFGGDIINDPSEFVHANIEYAYEWRRLIANLKNHHSVIGNHDDYHNSTDVTDITYAFLLAPEESPDMVMGGDFYYYIDVPCEKTRYLYLDSGQYSMSDAEAKWMIDTLASTPAGWHIVAISHIWWQYTAASAPTVGSWNASAKKALDLFDAYNARLSGTATMESTAHTYNFASASGKVEFCIGGHIHYDYDLESDDGIPVIITTADTNQDRVPDSEIDNGTVGTITESAVFGVIADYDNSKITVVGVGRGTSREIALS